MRRGKPYFMERRISRALFSTCRKRRKLRTLSRNTATVDAHGYVYERNIRQYVHLPQRDGCTILHRINRHTYRRGVVVARFDKVGNPTASIRGAGSRRSPRFFVSCGKGKNNHSFTNTIRRRSAI